jgi:hypothetical protein
MSLHKFAEQVAANGRGDDSLLVHMTPDEVRNLQQFAQANGTTLTINPTTGLPEAGLLSDLFKAVAPIALGAFLGPAGLGMSSMMAGVATGGITTLATGSLSRGLMAGLGAYGGAGLGSSLMGASGMTGGAALGAGMPADIGFNLADAGVTDAGMQTLGNVDTASKAIAQTQPTAFDKIAAGAKAVTASPGAAMDFAKGNLGNLAYAAAPIAAGMMVPTTTKLGDPKDTGYIRQFDYNINPDTGRPDPLYGMRAMTPVKASEFGNKTFQGQRDLFRQQNPNPYDIGIGSLNQPPQQQTTPMAGGGIVALADGGVPGFAGDKFSFVKDASGFDQDTINKALATELGARGGSSLADIREYAKTGYKLSDAQINAALDTIPGFNAQGTYDAADYMATSKPGQVSPQIVVDAANAANPFSAQNMAKVDTTRPGQYVQDASGNPVALTNYSPGFDINNPTALTYLGELSANPTKSDAATWFQQNATAEQKAKAADLWNKEKARLTALDVAAGRIPTDNKGLGDLNNNLTNQDQNKNLTNADAGLAALDAGKSQTYKWFEERGLGFTPIDKVIDNWFDEYTDDLALLPPDRQEKVMKDALNTENMNEADLIKATGKTIKDWIQIKTGDIKKVTPTYLPPGVSGGSDTVLNANGTVTTKPDFGLTMNDVRDTYTKGGGSLGYTSPVVKTPAEHEAAYNKLTDDSLDAYNFLMGKGKNLTQRKAETRDRPVMARYDEAVLGRKITKPTKTTTTTTTTVKGVPGQPQTYFDEAAYLAANPDVANEIKTGKSVSGQPTQFKSGYEHYLMYGKTGGRAFTGDYAGYLTALALADAAQQGGGDGPSGPSGGNNSNTISGFTPGLANPNISDVNMSTMSPAAAAAAAAAAADGAAAAAASASGTAPGSDGSPGSGAKNGGMIGYAMGGGLGSLGSYSDGGRLLRGPGDGVSDSIPATIGRKQQPARLADGEFVIPARIVSELGNGSTDAGAKKLYAMMDRVQRARGKTTGKNKVAANSRADKYLPA